MPLTANEAWSRLLDQAKQQLPLQTFRTWLEPTIALSYENDIIYVSVPDQFAADWNESKHSAMLSGLAPVALGQPISVIFKVNEERKARPQMDFFVAPPTDQKTGSGPNKSTMAPLSARYTFDHFVIGKSNELAAAAAQAVAQVPGKVYNPLFLYGDTGVGKTHLMQAIAHSILEKTPSTRITFIGTEQFTNELVASIQGRTTSDFRKRFRETDLLLIDDVHFLKGKEATQEEFFHTFNALYEGGRQIVLTSDRPPSEIPGLEARLISRFQWGMVADIRLPDLEHRIAILRHKAELDHLELTIPDDVTRFIAENIRSNVRELEGSIIKLLAYASLKHKEITVEVAKEALRDRLQGLASVSSSDSGISISVIQRLVAEEWGVTVEGLKSKTRTKALTVPRQVAMYLSRDLLRTQLVEIGKAFGGRDHSTVIHSLDRVNSDLSLNTELKSRIERVRSQLNDM
ncbi:MAG: chromosomal replication initiator protein DnaA [Nitrospiraceae bacterium]|nr:chromosomal replication initiator protein DnaA [Nitrospiraceae bacterium]